MANVAGRGRFCWFNLAAADTASAIGFYARIFGWKTSEKGGVTMWESPAGTVGSIGPLPESLDSGAWLPYVAVPDVAAAVVRARQLGASVSIPATATGMGGFFAHLQDPQGAAFGLYSPADTPYAAPAIGQFSWVELMTTNAPAAAAFYFELLGWKETSSMDMGAAGKYQMFGSAGIPYGGIFNPGQLPLGPQWVSYVRVNDVAAVTASAKAAGARVLNGPMEVPGGDWIVQFMDPQGVMIAAHEIVAKAAARPQPAAPKAKNRPAKKKARPTKALPKKKAPPRRRPPVKAKPKPKPKPKPKAKAGAKTRKKTAGKVNPRAMPRRKTARKAARRKK